MPFKVRGELHSRLKELEEKMEKGEATTTSPVDLVEEYFDHGSLLEPFTVEESRTGFNDPASRAEVLEAWLPQDGLQRAPVKLNVQVRPHFSSATPRRSAIPASATDEGCRADAQNCRPLPCLCVCA